MKSADPRRKLTAAQFSQILSSTSSRDSLSLTPAESSSFAAAKQKAGSDAPNITGEQFLFGNGLVNAEKAVAAVKQMQQ